MVIIAVGMCEAHRKMEIKLINLKLRLMIKLMIIKSWIRFRSGLQ